MNAKFWRTSKDALWLRYDWKKYFKMYLICFYSTFVGERLASMKSNAAVLHLNSSPPLPLPSHSTWSPQPNYPPHISLCNKATGVFQVLRNAAFNITIFGTAMCWNVLSQTQISSSAADVSWPEIVLKVDRVFNSDVMSINLPKHLSIQVFRIDWCLYISVFSSSIHAAHCGHAPRIGVVQLRVLQLHWAITSKYRSLILLFFVLNTHITPWNNSVVKERNCSVMTIEFASIL
jgi:hypothetical protein